MLRTTRERLCVPHISKVYFIRFTFRQSGLSFSLSSFVLSPLIARSRFSSHFSRSFVYFQFNINIHLCISRVVIVGILSVGAPRCQARLGWKMKNVLEEMPMNRERTFWVFYCVVMSIGLGWLVLFHFIHFDHIDFQFKIFSLSLSPEFRHFISCVPKLNFIDFSRFRFDCILFSFSNCFS